MKRFAKSLGYALRGLKYVIRNERNFQIELVVAIFVFLLMYLVNVQYQEKVFLVLMVVWVLALELTNTAIERIMDLLKPKVHPYVRVVKDTMAAAVLVSSVGAVAVGTIIFSHYVLAMLG
jgi:undecaprenol kinase